MPRESGASSTPRLLGSIINVSGILDHPHARVMTTGMASTCPRHCERSEAIHSFLCAAKWIASRSLSSGAHSRDPLARNDGAKHKSAFSRRDAPEL